MWKIFRSSKIERRVQYSCVFFCFNGHMAVNIYISMVEVFERQLSNILYVHDTTTCFFNRYKRRSIRASIISAVSQKQSTTHEWKRKSQKLFCCGVKDKLIRKHSHLTEKGLSASLQNIIRVQNCPNTITNLVSHGDCHGVSQTVIPGQFCVRL